MLARAGEADVVGTRDRIVAVGILAALAAVTLATLLVGRAFR
jgi:hypothetical protein